MSASDSKTNDKSRSLAEISSSLPSKSLISRLIDIQSYKVDHKKSVRFIENLEVLSFRPPKRDSDGQTDTAKPIVLRRQYLNALERSDFIALSYTWQPSPQFENDIPAGGYHVERRGSYRVVPSPVRNSVFDRVKRYMGYVGTEYLWIDQHCIEQQVGPDKEIGMQAMDLVYSKSAHPLTLLARPIQTSADLLLLVEILKGMLLKKGKPNHDLELSHGTSSDRALQAVKLLEAITADLWWTRGWTFQENYRALSRMTLLIPHAPDLEDQKRGEKYLLGNLPGELCIESWRLHQEATRLCLAYQSQQPTHRDLCQRVIARAPKYTILLQDHDVDGNTSASRSMSPRIFADITERELEQVWDRVPIAANCCQYSVRLDSSKLREIEPSISVAMLGLFLVNGEILSNHPDDEVDVEKARASNVIEFLNMQSYSRLHSPFPDYHLTFNKGCRFPQVEITDGGIQTKGHLWKVYRGFPAGLFSSARLPFVPRSTNGLYLKVRRFLGLLVDTLYDDDEKFLSKRLQQFLEYDLTVGDTKTFAKEWQDHMCRHLASAMKAGNELGISYLVHDYISNPSSGAIFVLENVAGRDSDEDSEDEDSEDEDSGDEDSGDEDSEDEVSEDEDSERNEDPLYVFTSSRPERADLEFDGNDIDHHVSVMVDCPDVEASIPQLFTKEWIHGLCFFKGCPQQDVLFPWPRSLRGL